MTQSLSARARIKSSGPAPELMLFYFQFYFIKFSGVTLVNKIIQVTSVDFYDT